MLQQTISSQQELSAGVQVALRSSMLNSAVNPYIIGIFSSSSWGWIICNEQVLLTFLQSWASVVFIFITVRVSLSLSYFLWRNDGEFDINVGLYIIAREKLFHPCKIGRAPYGVHARPGICWCYHIPMPASARTICNHARENSLKSSGARAIIKFAGDVQIAKIVRCQCYLWS